MKMTMSEELLYTTVKLNTFMDGVSTGSGTGFFYRINLADGKSSVILVTNKHVLAQSNRIIAICHLSGNDDLPSGKQAECTINIGPEGPFLHPSEDVDLCAVIFQDILNQAKSAGSPIFLKTIGVSEIPESDEWEYFDAIEEVIMIGCPRGLYDQHNNLPLVRRGITATSISKDYNGKHEFVVDMACFPGSSGSPVFIYNRDSYLDRQRNINVIGSYRLKFVGILFAGPLIQNDGTIVYGQAPRVEVASMMHLGFVVRSSAVISIEENVRTLVYKQ